MNRLLTYIFAFTVFFANGQSTDSLDREKGFAGIAFLCEIDSLPEFKTIFNDPDIENRKYEYAMLESNYSYLEEDEFLFPGIPGIQKVFLNVSDGLVCEIKLVCTHDSVVIQFLESKYGKPNIPYRTSQVENKDAEWTLCIWQGRAVRLMFTAKKYLKKKDSDESEIPDYMCIKVSSLETEKLLNKNRD